MLTSYEVGVVPYPVTPEWYDWYTQQPHWVDTRQRKKRANPRCEVCGVWSPTLQVHHLHYESLWREKLSDLQTICIPCHEEATSQQRRMKAQRRYWKAVNTYATKKYGQHWEEHLQFDEAAEDFDHWVARKRARR